MGIVGLSFVRTEVIDLIPSPSTKFFRYHKRDITKLRECSMTVKC